MLKQRRDTKKGENGEQQRAKRLNTRFLFEYSNLSTQNHNEYPTRSRTRTKRKREKIEVDRSFKAAAK